jgi:hypothetical protein
MHPQGQGGALTYLIPIAVIGLVILRNARARTLRMERLWIGPLLVVLLAGAGIAAAPPRTEAAIVVDIVALAFGAVLGWWRGRASRFTVDPETHVVTSRVSPWGMVLILAIFALRYGLRSFLGGGATVLHLAAADLADAFLLLALGVVCAQRIEWFIRARRMIAEARAA